MNARLRQLQKRWDHVAQRIDALSLRERVFTFLSLAMVLVLLLDGFFISPLSSEKAALSQTLQSQQQTVNALREQLSKSNQGGQDGGALALKRMELKALQDELLGLKTALKNAQADSSKLPRLQALLQELLQRHASLRLLRLDTLRDKDLPSSARVGDTLIQWQGVALELSGDYAELVAYLRRLELAMPGLHWGPMQLRQEGEDSVMRVQLYVLRSEAP